MGGPSRRRDKVVVHNRLIDRDFHVLPSGQLHFRSNGRIRGDLAPASNPGRGQDLGTVANRGDRLAGLEEVAHAFQNLLV